MTIIDMLGYAAAIGTTGAYIPQAYKVYKTKKTEDLSLGTFIMLCSGIILWIIYGIAVNVMPVILANLATLIMTFYILVIKLKHCFRKNKSIE
jgi:MtN3 and saliva related transmembrane protein